MDIGIKSNPISEIIQKLNSAIVFVQLVQKSFIQILTYRCKQLIVQYNRALSVWMPAT
jgi:hypothetical protein